MPKINEFFDKEEPKQINSTFEIKNECRINRTTLAILIEYKTLTFS